MEVLGDHNAARMRMEQKSAVDQLCLVYKLANKSYKAKSELELVRAEREPKPQA